MDLAVDVYHLMAHLPPEEMYALTTQIKKCAVSIPLNIAEGAGRSSDKDFARFLDISCGSGNEMQSQLILAERLDYLTGAQLGKVFSDLEEVQKMSFGLLKTIR